MDEITKKCYSSFLKGNIIVNGSIKNNSIPIKKNENNSKKILFLSQYRNPKLFKHIDIWGNKISFANHFKTETKLIPLLADYCKKHQIYFEICGASKNYEEAYFYKSLIKEKNNNWNFCPKVDIQTTYEMVDQATAIVFIDTTLGYEALSRGIPVAAFSTRGKNLNFGLPKQFSDRGPFWTNYLDETTLNEILGLVLNISKEDWNKIYNKHARDIASYDEGNKKFKNILKSINIPLVKQN